MRLQRRDSVVAGGGGQVHTLTPRISTLAPLSPPRGEACRALPCPASLPSLLPGGTLEVSQPCLHLSWPSPGPSPSSHLPWIWLPSVLSQLSPLPGSPPCAPLPHTSVYPSRLQTTSKCPHLSPLCPDLPYAKHRVWQGVGVKSFLNATRNGGALVSSGLAWSSPGRRMKDMWPARPPGDRKPSQQALWGGAKKAKSHLCCPQLSYVALTYRGHRPII